VLASVPEEKNRLLANQVLQTMKKQGVRPDKISYSIVMQMWARVGDLEQSLEVMEKMKEDYRSGNKQAKPDLQCFNIALTALKRFDLPDASERAEKMLLDIRKEGLEPDVHTFSQSTHCACSN
jgi:pentatricopeptide repeat protein